MKITGKKLLVFCLLLAVIVPLEVWAKRVAPQPVKPLFCVCVAAILQFFPLPWHIWNAKITYLGNRNEWQEVIKNPAEENLISRTAERTVIGFLHGESILTRYEKRIVYISDDALPQKEMFPFAEKVKIYRKLAPNWYYLQVKY